jgi:hypothetical protein
MNEWKSVSPPCTDASLSTRAFCSFCIDKEHTLWVL